MITACKHRDPNNTYPMKLRLELKLACRLRLDRLQRYRYEAITHSTDLKALSKMLGLAASSSVSSL